MDFKEVIPTTKEGCVTALTANSYKLAWSNLVSTAHYPMGGVCWKSISYASKDNNAGTYLHQSEKPERQAGDRPERVVPDHQGFGRTWGGAIPLIPIISKLCGQR